MLDRKNIKPVDLPPDLPLLLIVVIDTEEEFDWGQPLSRDNTATESIAAQHLAQEVFARHGIVPTYVIDYPVATDRAAYGILKAYLDDGLCEIGTHLHPWVNPPHEEQVTPGNSYPGNLPPDLELAKLETLTQAIAANLGHRPVVYKAGRYGVGPNTTGILQRLGYRIDLSVVARTAFTDDGGPDFGGFDFQPYWFGPGHELLEIPLSAGFAGVFSRFGPTAYPRLFGKLGMTLRAPGIAARLGLLERIRLTPEGIDHAAHRRLTEALLTQGCRIFYMAYHSPSLRPGLTPYVRDERELQDFLKTIDRYLDYFLGELGGRATTPTKLYELLRGTHPTALESGDPGIDAGDAPGFGQPSA